MTEQARIFEVGPRDGLQNEAAAISTADKVTLVDLLSDAGFSRIEVAAFVSPKWVPQMADGAAVLAGITRKKGVSYAALAPNLRGYRDAIAARADEIAIFASASEGFSQANINCSVKESLARFAPVIRAAQEDGVPVRGYVSCVTDCPFDGPVDPGAVARLAATLCARGCYEVSLGDTIGQGTPETITRMLRAVLEEVPASRLAGHYHDTTGRALENIEASLALGVRVFDAAAGGLGGCPFAPGSAGNVATERVNDFLLSRGLKTGLDADRIATAAKFARTLRGSTVREGGDV